MFHGDDFRQLNHKLDALQKGQDHLHELLHALSRTVQTQGESIMATQQEMAAALAGVNEKLKKIGQETTTLLLKIDELKVQVENAPVSPALQQAFDALAAQAQVLDDLVPDAPTP